MYCDKNWFPNCGLELGWRLMVYVQWTFNTVDKNNKINWFCNVKSFLSPFLISHDSRPQLCQMWEWKCDFLDSAFPSMGKIQILDSSLSSIKSIKMLMSSNKYQPDLFQCHNAATLTYPELLTYFRILLRIQSPSPNPWTRDSGGITPACLSM